MMMHFSVDFESYFLDSQASDFAVLLLAHVNHQSWSLMLNWHHTPPPPLSFSFAALLQTHSARLLLIRWKTSGLSAPCQVTIPLLFPLWSLPEGKSLCQHGCSLILTPFQATLFLPKICSVAFFFSYIPVAFLWFWTLSYYPPHPHYRLFWPKSKSFDYLYSDGEALLRNFPIQATISFYEESDSEDEDEEDWEEDGDKEECLKQQSHFTSYNWTAGNLSPLVKSLRPAIRLPWLLHIYWALKPILYTLYWF